MDVVGLLNYMSSQGLLRLNKITGDYYSVYCPFHNGGQERRPSAGVLLHDQYRNGQHYPEGMFNCFTCHTAGNINQWVSKLLSERVVSDDVKKYIQEQIGTRVNTESGKLFSEDIGKALQAKFAINSIQSIIQNNQKSYIDETELAQYRLTVPYMYERKLTDDIIEKYDVGVDLHYVPKGGNKEIPCITFPVRDRTGKSLFIVRRAIPIKRFYMPDDIQKPVYGLYELPKNCKSVVIVESCFNALTSVRYGRPAVALLGTGTPYQIEQLKRLGVREFILGFDPDEAGERATRRLKKALKSVALIWQFSGIPIGKDINDLSEEEFRSLEII